VAPSASAPAPVAPRAAIKPLTSSKHLSQRDLAVFNSVCQLAETGDGIGCRCCPDEPAAKWCAEQTGEPMTTIEHVFYGAFSRPGATEAYATGHAYPCGNLSAWGASWFFRQDSQGWSLVRGERAAHHVLHAAVWDLADGRRGIVSHDVISKLFNEAIALTTFAADGAPSRAELLTWSNAPCYSQVPGFYGAQVRYVGANPIDHDQDGKRDLVVTLKVKRRFADDAFQRECTASIEKSGVPSPFDRAPAKEHAIPLIFDGARFTPEARALAGFEQAIAVVDQQGNAFEP